MKKLPLLSAFLIFACSPFCSYSQNAFVNIETEAYKEFRKKGGSNQQWVDYKGEIIKRYKNKYYSKGESQQQAIKKLNQSQQQMQMRKNGTNHRYNQNSPKSNPRYTKGTIILSNGQMASFNSGQVSNGMGQTVGYYNQGMFSDSYQNCVGYVRGNSLYNCSGGVIASIQNNRVYSQGNLIYVIKGDQLTRGNYVIAQIYGMDMSSLAAYLLFLS